MVEICNIQRISWRISAVVKLILRVLILHVFAIRSIDISILLIQSFVVDPARNTLNLDLVVTFQTCAHADLETSRDQKDQAHAGEKAVRLIKSRIDNLLNTFFGRFALADVFRQVKHWDLTHAGTVVRALHIGEETPGRLQLQVTEQLVEDGRLKAFDVLLKSLVPYHRVKARLESRHSGRDAREPLEAIELGQAATAILQYAFRQRAVTETDVAFRAEELVELRTREHHVLGDGAISSVVCAVELCQLLRGPGAVVA